MRSNPEYQLHKQVADFLSLALPEHCFFTTIGHGGGGLVRGARLKALGLVAGVPDILILFTGRPILIELKAKRGSLSPEQRQVHERIILAGGVVTTCKSLEAVEQFLAVCGVPLRARTKRAAA